MSHFLFVTGLRGQQRERLGMKSLEKQADDTLKHLLYQPRGEKTFRFQGEMNQNFHEILLYSWFSSLRSLSYSTDYITHYIRAKHRDLNMIPIGKAPLGHRTRPGSFHAAALLSLIILYGSFLFVLFKFWFLNYIQECSGLTPGSVVRDYYQRNSRSLYRMPEIDCKLVTSSQELRPP